MRLHCELMLTLAAMPLLVASPVGAVKSTSAEIARAHDWAMARFGDGQKAPSAGPPFSFTYGDRPSSEFLNTWKVERKSRKLDKAKIERVVTYTDPATGLVVTCRAIEYDDFPTIEWTLFFKNTGKAGTPVISDVRPLDVSFVRKTNAEFQLHYHTADNCTQDSYAPHVEAMGPDAAKQFACAGGRPTTGAYPYYNVEMDGGGAIVVLSWAGQWSSEFKRDSGKTLRVRGGQELTHFTLHPGEEVSSPLAVLQFYDGDWIRAQNVWRRWMFVHNISHIKGVMPSPMLYMCSNGYFDGLRSNLEAEKLFIDRYAAERIGVEYWDMDAGWYPCDPAVGWPQVGNWEPDTDRFPGGLKAMSDHLHSKNIKFILWFEPERVSKGTWLARNHPDWIYGGAEGGLVKLGDPECRKWITEHFDNLITTQGVDVYRQDFNMDPLPYWRGNDTEDRQGITEIRHVEGYYAYWDELRRRHPNLLIDTCASGGRRNNLETLRRSVPILRSDYTMDPIGNQGHTYGLSMWVPINGTGLYMKGAYENRSTMAPIYGIAWDVRKEGCDWDLMRRMVKEWRHLSKCMMGDYYPLTPYSLEKNAWIAWQFDLPEKGEGMVEAFRRDDCAEDSRVFKLQGLDLETVYAVENLDAGKTEELTGERLMGDGLRINIADRPGSALIAYQRAR
jgi:alpha-galactosidase